MIRPTALIVDDHAGVRTMVAQVLIEGGFDIVGEAADGTQALEMAARFAPDVITLDVSMPGMDGLEALPSLRSQLPGAVIVMLTVNREFEKKALQDGADAYILKNRMVELIPAIRAARSRAEEPRNADEDLIALQVRLKQAQRNYAELRRQAKEAGDLFSDVQKDAVGTADGTFAAAKSARLEEAAHRALGESLEALAELNRLTGSPPVKPATKTD